MAGVLGAISASAAAGSSVAKALGYTTAAKVFGWIAIATGAGAIFAAAGSSHSLIIKNFASSAEKTTPLWQRILGGISAVGAIANSFTNDTKKADNLTPDQILNIVVPLVKAALSKLACRQFVGENGDPVLDKDPRVTLKRLKNKKENYQLINEGKNNPANSGTIAQGGMDIDTAGNVKKPTIRLWKPFFSDTLGLNTSPNAAAGLSKFDLKALALLHELKHVYSGPAPPSHDAAGVGGMTKL